MKHKFSSIFQNTFHKRSAQSFLSLLTIPLLTACPVDSTSISDSDIIANFFVQNDNGEASALVTLGSRDLGGRNDVTLSGREAIFFEQDGQGGELREEDDGEYTASLPANASGLFTFTIERMSRDFEEDFADQAFNPLFFEIDNNQAYLPDTFQELVAEPVQLGPEIDISWRVDDTQQIINGFTVPAAVESFNAIANCQNSDQSASDDSSFDIAITEGQITQEGGRQLLKIAVTEQLTQVLNLSAEVAALTACEFDVQLVRDINGTTDIALDRRSTASGQTLKNLSVQWSAQ